MGHSPEAQRTASVDGLRGGGLLAKVSLAASLVSVAVLLLDPMWWNATALTRSAQAVGALQLSTVAFCPSGRSERHPARRRLGVGPWSGASWLRVDPAPVGWVTTAIPLRPGAAAVPKEAAHP
jgi:hypothetical protein